MKALLNISFPYSQVTSETRGDKFSLLVLITSYRKVLGLVK